MRVSHRAGPRLGARPGELDAGMRNRHWIVAVATAATVASAVPPPALAARGDCSQPISSGASPTATDCLTILGAAVGTTTCAPYPDCVCAPKGTLPTSATDALVCLSAAVGGGATLACPCGGDCTLDSECDDGEPCNGFESCDAGSCVDGPDLLCDADDLVVVVPYQSTPGAVRARVEASTAIPRIDAYLLLDRAPSVSDEVAALKAGVSSAVRAAACAPVGTGSPPDCIPDLFTGVGWIGYAGTAGESYRNRRDLQPDPDALSIRFPTSDPAGCCSRTTLLALWATATGKGNLNAPCSVGSSFGIRPDCRGTPAGEDGIGYPCFRPGALRAVVLVTDEQPSTGHTCTSVSKTTDAARTEGIRIVSLYGAGTPAAAINELQTLATSTDAVDANDADAPLVFNAGVGSIGPALTTALRTLSSGARFSRVTASVEDDPSDLVDATAFVGSVRTAQLGTTACPDGLAEQDTDFDGAADAYLAIPAGTPLCWNIVPAANTTVPATASAQLFRAIVSVDDTGFEGLDAREIFFVVPPAP